MAQVLPSRALDLKQEPPQAQGIDGPLKCTDHKSLIEQKEKPALLSAGFSTLKSSRSLPVPLYFN
jgi:hypothetical protein